MLHYITNYRFCQLLKGVVSHDDNVAQVFELLVVVMEFSNIHVTVVLPLISMGFHKQSSACSSSSNKKRQARKEPEANQGL